MSDPTTPSNRLDAPIPRAVASPLAGRAFAQDVAPLIRRINRLAKASRAVNGESREVMSRAAQADGIGMAPSSIERMETKANRSEVDLIRTLWTLFRGGYTLADLYPSAAGAGASDLTAEERALLRHYRDAKPSMRSLIVSQAELMARADASDQEPSERPTNLREMPRREAGAEDAAAQDATHERRRGKGSRPRRMYGNGA
jgi:hypothetical protein